MEICYLSEGQSKTDSVCKIKIIVIIKLKLKKLKIKKRLVVVHTGKYDECFLNDKIPGKASVLY